MPQRLDTKSTMNVMEYIDGFTEANINDYDYSNGTKIPYVHYKLTFPNNDMQINKSGNYVMIVYEYNKETQFLSQVYAYRKQSYD